MKNPSPAHRRSGFPTSWSTTSEVRQRKPESLGGTVMKNVTPVPNYGEFSVITDPTGAHFALWKPKKKQANVASCQFPVIRFMIWELSISD